MDRNAQRLKTALGVFCIGRISQSNGENHASVFVALSFFSC